MTHLKEFEWTDGNSGRAEVFPNCAPFHTSARAASHLETRCSAVTHGNHPSEASVAPTPAPALPLPTPCSCPCHCNLPPPLPLP